ncbi:MAG: hypothetical protein GY863_11765, partial [bacterium]|nr:hypothetical protein [bacterium]
MKKLKKIRICQAVVLLTFIFTGLTADIAESRQEKPIGKHGIPYRMNLGNGLTLNLSDNKVTVDPLVHLNIPFVSYDQDADAKAYREAYKNILNEKWDKAVDSLKEFKEDYPKSRRLSSAEYWICFSHEKLDYSDEKVFELYEEFIE